jgi:hypothetical protein
MPDWSTRPRRARWSTHQLTCSRCRAPIAPRETFNLDRTGAPHHPECRRIGTHTRDLGPAHSRGRRPQPTCPGCWQLIAPGEQTVTAAGSSWHQDCCQQEAPLA